MRKKKTNKTDKTAESKELEGLSSGPESLSLQTRLITSGRKKGESSLAPPLYPSTAHENPSPEKAADMAMDFTEARYYTRHGNPTTNAFEEAMAELEGAERSRAFASGMGAVSAVILGLADAGDHIVAQSQLYAVTISLLQSVQRRFGIEVSFVDGTQPGAFVDAVRPGQTRLIFAETPANPKLGIIDLKELAAIKGPVKVVDSTLAPPVVQRPLDFGIDLSLHSATKSIGGHNDASLGVVSGSVDLISWIWTFAVQLGANASPADALNGIRGIRTLGVRQQRQCSSALKISEMLEGQNQVKAVFYPGLKSHPQHDLAMKQMSCGGSLVAFDLKGGLEAGRAFINGLKLARLAPSLGGPETLVTHPASTTHAGLTSEEYEKAGIEAGTIRISVGLEDINDLLVDIGAALSVI